MTVMNSTTIRRFKLVLLLSLKSIFSKYHLKRLLLMASISVLMGVVMSIEESHGNAASSLFEILIGNYGGQVVITMCITIALVGWIYISPNSKIQIRTITAHPVPAWTIFLSRYLIIVLIVSMIQYFAGLGVLLFVLMGFTHITNTVLFGEALPTLIGFLWSSIIASFAIGLLFASVFTVFPILIKRANVAYLLNFMIVIVWEIYCSNTNRYPMIIWRYFYLGPAGLVRNILYQLNVLFQITDFGRISQVVINEMVGLSSPMEVFGLQILVWALMVTIGFILSWIAFVVKSRRW